MRRRMKRGIKEPVGQSFHVVMEMLGVVVLR